MPLHVHNVYPQLDGCQTATSPLKPPAGKLSFHQRKVLEDVAGVPVFTMKHKGLSLHQTKQLWAGESDAGAPVLEARQEVTFIQAYKQCTIRATARDLISGSTVYITLLGDVRGKSEHLCLALQGACLALPVPSQSCNCIA